MATSFPLMRLSGDMILHRTQCAECRSEVNFCEVGPRRQAQARLAGLNRGRPEAPGAACWERAQIRWASRAAPGSPIVIPDDRGGRAVNPKAQLRGRGREALRVGLGTPPEARLVPGCMASAVRAAATLGGASPLYRK